MSAIGLLDADRVLRQVSRRIPEALLGHVVVIGSIAAAWSYRRLAGTAAVATKDVDLLLQPSVTSIVTARELGQVLLGDGWSPIFADGFAAGHPTTPDDKLPALRLRPPGTEAGWFVELLAEPDAGQLERRRWRRFATSVGVFGLPSFRFTSIAIDDAELTPFGLRVARPARMAMANLLEHANPDVTPISNIPGNPPRFVKDVGRAVAMYWLARLASPMADDDWLEQWQATSATVASSFPIDVKSSVAAGLGALSDFHREAHVLAAAGLLAPFGIQLESWLRAYRDLQSLVDRWRIEK